MRICMVGTGYVGLVSGACFSETGANVVCADIDGDKIARLERGEIPIFEPGLAELVERNTQAKRLRFSNNIPEAIAWAEVVFIAVGTPPRSDGAADLSAVDKVADAVALHAERELVLVLKSTVPVGTNARVRRIVESAKHPIHVVSNPEFLKEGDAVRDFMKPDRIVIGLEDGDQLARDMMTRLYHPVSLGSDRIIWMDPASAELTKYVANTMLAMRISFMNEVAALCEKVGADVHQVRQGVGSDERIGDRFLFAGPGYGGSCLHGREMVFVRHKGVVRLVRFDDLFAELAQQQLRNVPEASAITTGDLQVLAWDRTASNVAFHRCSAVTRRPFEGELVEIRTKMGRRVRCTPDHPMVVVDPTSGQSAVKLARDLQDSDWIPLATRRAPIGDGIETIDVLAHLDAMGIDPSEVIVRLDDEDRAAVRAMGHEAVSAALDHPRGLDRAYDIRRTGAVRLNEARALDLKLEKAMLGTARNGTFVPRRFALGESFWRIVGLYLAEGQCTTDGRRRRLCWSFHPSAEPELVDEVASFWRSLDVKCDVRRGSTTMQVSISSRIVAGLFLDVLQLGGDSYSHRIPHAIWQQPGEHQRALLSGLWHGDGSWSRVGGGPSVVLEYGTVSRQLAEGMLQLLGAIGFVARVKVARMSKSTRDTYFLILSGADQVERAIDLVKKADRADVLQSIARQAKRIAPTGYRPLHDGISALRVTGFDAVPYQGFVYSLEVEAAHTIVTSGGIVVHNCFPKDVAALVHTGHEHGVDLELTATTDRVNQRQKGVLARKLKHTHFGGDLRGKRICLWGIAFKPRTDDIRESPALQLIDALLSEGAEVHAHDPEALENARARYGDRVRFADDAYAAAEGADALVLVTEWREYQNPDFTRLREVMRRPLLLDGRNIWSSYGLRRQGFEYDGIGVKGS